MRFTPSSTKSATALDYRNSKTELPVATLKSDVRLTAPAATTN